MDLSEIVFGILGIVIGFLLGWLTNWFFYKEQRKDGEANTKILQGLQQKGDTEIRRGNDERGKIIKNPDGTYAIEWTVKAEGKIGLVGTLDVIVNKKRGKANFEIKHDGNGKETMTITYKDENGKERKIEMPWETIQQLRK